MFLLGLRRGRFGTLQGSRRLGRGTANLFQGGRSRFGKSLNLRERSPCSRDPAVHALQLFHRGTQRRQCFPRPQPLLCVGQRSARLLRQGGRPLGQALP